MVADLCILRTVVHRQPARASLRFKVSAGCSVDVDFVHPDLPSCDCLGLIPTLACCCSFSSGSLGLLLGCFPFGLRCAVTIKIASYFYLFEIIFLRKMRSIY